MEAFQSEWIRACRECHVHGKANHFKLTRGGESPSAAQPIELQGARDACLQPGHVEALAGLLSSKSKKTHWAQINTVRTLSLNYGALHGDALSRCVPALAALFTCSTVAEVELFHTGLTDASAAAVASVLCSKDCRITRLKLGENYIGDAGAEALGEALRHNASLQQLNLAGNQLTDVGVRHLAEGLSHNTSLTGLCLRHNPFGAAGVHALSQALCAQRCAVTELQLKGANVGVSGAAALADVLLRDQSRGGGAPLATLELEETHIGPQGVLLLAASVANNQSLTKLNLNGNRVGDAGAAAFGTALSQNSTLTALGMRANGVTGKGAESLAFGLRGNAVMTGLDVGDNQLGSAGAIALANLLKSTEGGGRTGRASSGLQCVNLGGNQIDGEGIRALAEALHSNTKLTHLDVSFNGILDSDVSALACVLRHNSSLTRLCLAGSRFGALGYNALLRAMEGNSTLRSLTLNARGTPYDPAVFSLRQSLVDRVEENKVLWKEQQQQQQPAPTHSVPAPAPVRTPLPVAAPAVAVRVSPPRIPSPGHVQQQPCPRASPLPTPPASSPNRNFNNLSAMSVDPRGLNARAMPFQPSQPQMMSHQMQMGHAHVQQGGGSPMMPQQYNVINNTNAVQINTNLQLNVQPSTAPQPQFYPFGIMMGQQSPVGAINGIPVYALTSVMLQNAMCQQSVQQQLQPQPQPQPKPLPQQHFTPPPQPPQAQPPCPMQMQDGPLMTLQRFASALQPQSPNKSTQGSKFGNDLNSPVKSPLLLPHDLWAADVGEEFTGGLGVCGSTGSLDLNGVMNCVLENALASGVFCIEEEDRTRVCVNGGHA